ncbi:MAG: hypothetical protein K8T89_20180, partial [Planctomycetes bacterium]|nr:hypothetical protein [Planctomycetota bacterium]
MFLSIVLVVAMPVAADPQTPPNDEVIARLLNRLEAKSREERLQAALDCGILKIAKSKEALEKRLKSEGDETVRLFAIIALHSLAENEAALLEALGKQSQSQDEQVVAMVAAYCVQLEAKGLPLLEEICADDRKELPKLEDLLLRQAKGDQKRLLAYLKSKNAYVRAECCWAVSRILEKGKPADDQILALLLELLAGRETTDEPAAKALAEA